MQSDIINSAGDTADSTQEGEELLAPIDLIVSSMSALELPKDSAKLQAVLRAASILAPLHTVMAAAFAQGGLDNVDAVVDTINTALQQAGSRLSLGDGAALRHDAEGKPEALIITFMRPGSGRPLLFEFIELTSG